MTKKIVFSNLELKEHLKACKGFHLMKKIYYKSSIPRERSARKCLKRMAKKCSTSANPKDSLSWVSFAKDYADQLPATIIFLAIYKGKVGKSKSYDVQTFEDEEAPLGYVSLLQEEQPDQPTLGWPFVRRKAFTGPEALRQLEDRNISVVQRVLNLPDRPNHIISQNDIDMSSYEEIDISTFNDQETEKSEDELEENLEQDCEREVEISSSLVSFDGNESPLSRPGWPLLLIAPSTTPDFSKQFQANINELKLLAKASSSGCRIFKYAELKAATSQFSLENIIGEGGCSTVYKGHLPSGKTVAVKVLKSYKEAWNDFSLEVNIVSSINHKHISPLIGLSVENSHLLSVYDFYPNGSLEENLHGENGRSILGWESRFNVAVAVAEALNYLHNICPQPVIHRDIKSSNILLTNDLKPQLSDFGLAMWGSKDSDDWVDSDVVGTFGYIAPEYFMCGRMSEKIDVYAYGVVLLELLSGRGPIGTKVPKGQESLVKWARYLFKRGEYKELLDPKLKGNYDSAQMQRVVWAARLCISQSDGQRPDMSRVLKLLRGEKNANELVLPQHIDMEEEDYQEDDTSSPEFGSSHQPCSSCEEIETTFTTSGENRRLTLKDFFNQRLD